MPLFDCLKIQRKNFSILLMNEKYSIADVAFVTRGLGIIFTK